MGFFQHTVEVSHLYLWHFFFLRGGTPFCSLGSNSSSEQSLFDNILWGGSLSCLSYSFHFSLLYILDVCRHGGVLITLSIHASSFISLFGGGFFPCGFSLFPHFLRDCICIHYVHGYLTWPSSQDPSCISSYIM